MGVYDVLRALRHEGASEIAPLSPQRGCSPSGCPVDFLDTATGVVVDLETVTWPVSRKIKHALLQHRGYRPVRLRFWDLEAARLAASDWRELIAQRVPQALGARVSP